MGGQRSEYWQPIAPPWHIAWFHFWNGSAWTDAWVDIPVDADLFYEKLQEKIRTSSFKKAEEGSGTMNVDGSF